MKKILSASLLLFVLFAGFLVAIPHAHEGDWTHANHQSCPIYQASLQEWGASVAPLIFASGLALLAFLVPWRLERFEFQPLSLPDIRCSPLFVLIFAFKFS